MQILPLCQEYWYFLSEVCSSAEPKPPGAGWIPTLLILIAFNEAVQASDDIFEQESELERKGFH